MKNSNFGQGKRVPPQFNDYLNILAGAETILIDLLSKIETTMQDYFRSLNQSEIESNISDLIVKQYTKQMGRKFQVVLDKFDIYMKEKFEDHYINFRRNVHKKQLRQHQKKVINLENYDLFTKKHNNIEDKLTKEFEEYFLAFIEKLDSDTSNFIESREKSRSDNFINYEFEKILKENDNYIFNQDL